MIENRILNARRSYESLETDAEGLFQRVQEGVIREAGISRLFPKDRSLKVTRRLSMTVAGSIVVCAGIIGTGFVSPVMASVLRQIPVVGSVFQYVHDFGLKTASEKGMTAQVGQSVTDNGIALQIQEVMYDGDRLSIGYIQQTEKGFSNWQGPTDGIKFKIDGKPYKDSVSGSGPNPIDNLTGVGQITLQPFKQKLPDEFELTMEVKAVSGTTGNWTFTIPVKKTVSAMKNVTPMVTRMDGETTLTLKKITFTPGTMDMDVEYRRPEAKSRDYIDFQVETDKGIILKNYGSEGTGHFENGEHVQLARIHFGLLNNTPKSIMIRPIAIHPIADEFDESPRRGVKVAMDQEPSANDPLILPQGEAGRLLVTKVERLKDKTIVQYRAEGSNPHEQASALLIEDLKGKYNFKIWESYIIPEKETKMIDAETYAYVREFPALKPDEELVFVTQELKNPIFMEDLEMTIPIQ